MSGGEGVFSGGFAVFDFETTGLSPTRGHRVVQVAVVSVNAHGVVENDWVSLINPGRPMAASHVHGITDDDVRDAPPFPAIWPKLQERFASRIAVAHNASFDLRFLTAELRLMNQLDGIRPFRVFDTLRLAHLVDGAVNKRQRSLAAALGVDPLHKPGRGPHDALTDSHVAAEILRHYLDRWPNLLKKEIQTFPNDFRISHVAQEVRGLPSQQSSPR